MARQLEQTSNYNECCSGPSSPSVPASDLCESTKTISNRVIEFVSQLYNNILTLGEWQSLQIIQLGPTEAQE